MPEPQFVSRMLAESIGHVWIHDPPALRLPVSGPGDRSLLGDGLLGNAPQAASAGPALHRLRLQPLPDARVLCASDIEIEAERPEIVVIDLGEVRGDEAAG